MMHHRYTIPYRTFLCIILCIVGNLFWGVAYVGAATWTLTSGYPNDSQDITSSSDGTKLAIVKNSEYIYLSTDSGATWSTSTSPAPDQWYGITSSSDGTKLAVTVGGGHIFTSTDSGATWATSTTAIGTKNWRKITSSSDGSKLVAIALNGYIFYSTNSGATWATSTAIGTHAWSVITSSSDGTKLAAGTATGYIYTSTDSGATWATSTASGSRNWQGINSSSDGTKLAAMEYGGYVYTSTDSGATWATSTALGTGSWGDITSSSDGEKIVVTDYGGNIHNSTDGGATWKTQDSVRNWKFITSSSDGTKVVAVATGSGVYTTTLNLDFPAISDIDVSATSSGATITWDTDIAADSKVYYGTTVSYTSSSSLSSSLVTSHTRTLSGLACNTLYHYRVDSRSEDGVLATSSDQTLTTAACTPTVTTSAASSVTKTGAVLNGNITSNGAATSSTVRGFVYGTSVAYGATTTDSGTFSTGAFTTSIDSLVCNTAYHVSAYATNASGTAYGSDVTFTTSKCSTSGGSGGGGGSSHGGGGGGVTHTPETTAQAIQRIQAQLALLIDLIRSMGGTVPVIPVISTPSSLATRNLMLSMEGDDVTALQKILIAANKGPRAQALAHVGASNFFGLITFNALIEYQRAVGIVPASGYFGPTTRAVMKANGVPGIWW